MRLTHNILNFKVKARGSKVKSPQSRLWGAEGADIPQCSLTFSRIKHILLPFCLCLCSVSFRMEHFHIDSLLLPHSTSISQTSGFLLFLRNFHTLSNFGRKFFHSLTNRRSGLVLSPVNLQHMSKALHKRLQGSVVEHFLQRYSCVHFL